MDIIRKNYPDIPIIGPHHQAVRVGNLLFLAGTTAKMTDAEYGNMTEQTEAVLEIIKRILEAEGGTLDNVVKITNFGSRSKIRGSASNPTLESSAMRS